MEAAGSDPGGAGRPVATGIQYAGAAEGGSEPGTGEECGRWRFAALAAAVPNHEWQPTNRTPAASQGVVRLHAAVVWIVAGGRGTGAASGVCQSSELAIRADFRATKGICGADCAGRGPLAVGTPVDYGNRFAVAGGSRGCNSRVFLEREATAHEHFAELDHVGAGLGWHPGGPDGARVHRGFGLAGGNFVRAGRGSSQQTKRASRHIERSRPRADAWREESHSRG